MKTLPYLALLAILTLLGCKKDTVTTNNQTVEQLLTAHTWKMEEITQLENNVLIYYKRGGSTNTNNYDNDKLIFSANGTGTYSPQPTQTYTTTWQFINAEKTKMDLVINFGSGIILTLKCSELKVTTSSFFCVTQYTSTAGRPVLASVLRTPL